MFIEYDDGSHRIIARGGPSNEGLGFGTDGLKGELRVRAQVTPAQQSKDNGKSERLIKKVFLPGVTASQAAQPARDEARMINKADNLYGAGVNSNSFVGDVTEKQFGRRAGDAQTWGYKTQLNGGGFSPQMEKARRLLGTGLGSTPLGGVTTRLAEEGGQSLTQFGEDVGQGLSRLGEGMGQRLNRVASMPGY
jgi:hypothetical protein